VEGIIAARVGAGGIRASCAVIAKGWPSWAFGAHGAGLSVRGIILCSSKWEAVVSGLFPEAKVVTLAQPFAEDRRIKDVEVHQVDLVMTDVDSPGGVDMWNLGLSTVVSSRRFRRVPKGWRQEMTTINHGRCGGVTDVEFHIHMYHKEGESRWGKFELAEAGLRDLTAILDTRARHGVPCSAPDEVRFEVPKIVKFGGRSTYHSGGWLPGGVRDLLVIAANSFSPTNWCRRKLSPEEGLMVQDFPSYAIKA
jgi:hypothetical protein